MIYNMQTSEREEFFNAEDTKSDKSVCGGGETVR